MLMNNFKEMQYIKIFQYYVLITNQKEDELLNIYRNSCMLDKQINGIKHKILINKIFNKFTFPQYLEFYEK